jgi:hypothetical protein
MEGFLVRDFADRWDVALKDLQAMASQGQVEALEDIREGLEAAPSALVGMMSGGNLGQLTVRLRPGPTDWPTTWSSTVDYSSPDAPTRSASRGYRHPEDHGSESGRGGPLETAGEQGDKRWSEEQGDR